MDCASIMDNWKYKGKYLISDGGITTPGDVAKALVFADMVMVRKHVGWYRRNPRIISRA